MLTLRKEKMQINQGVWETVKAGEVYTYHPVFLLSIPDIFKENKKSRVIKTLL